MEYQADGHNAEQHPHAHDVAVACVGCYCKFTNANQLWLLFNHDQLNLLEKSLINLTKYINSNTSTELCFSTRCVGTSVAPL